MTYLTPVMRLIYSYGERVWFRNVSRSVNYTTGETDEAYADNKSTTVRIVETKEVVDGRSIFLDKGKAVGYCDPIEYWNDSMQVKVNDQLIRLPDNYSAGTSIIYRVDGYKRINLFNQSQYYLRLDLAETESKE